MAALAVAATLPLRVDAATAAHHGVSAHPLRDNSRAEKAYEMRVEAAESERDLRAASISSNGDEDRYPDRAASYSKGLRHNVHGIVDGTAYAALLAALRSEKPGDFERLPVAGVVKLSNPQAAFAYTLEGADATQYAIPAPPALASAAEAAEAVELYWQALTRDVPFSDYETNALTIAAAGELTRLDAFHGARRSGSVTPATLFRGLTAGDVTGPYVSQFLWKPVPYGTTPITQKIRTSPRGLDFLSGFDDWLYVQNGGVIGGEAFDSAPRYIRNSRDLAAYVHHDFTYQAFLNAALMLGAMNVPFDAANPYRHSLTQSSFATFGASHILDLVARVTNAGLIAGWYQKWLVHRRLRPEEYGARIQTTRTGVLKYPVHADILHSAALDSTFARTRSYLLPQAYPEGAPTHPSYPAGHAIVAGACATVLKAFYDESYILQDPVIASADGLTLSPYNATNLTVGGELNKLASNIAFGRDAAGVHWRSDGTYGLLLGEAVALSILAESRRCFTEQFDGFSLMKFDGTTVTV